MSTPMSGWLPWVGMGVAVFLAGWGWLRYRQARSRLEAALAHSTASRQQVVDNIPDGFLRVDRDGVILEANGVTRRVQGEGDKPVGPQAAAPTPIASAKKSGKRGRN